MKLYGGYTRFVGGRWLPGQACLRLFRAVAVAVLLLANQLNDGAAIAAPSAPGVHVYLMRGVLNVFSLGLDDIAAKLQAQGINATVSNYLFWSSVADDAAAEYRSGKIRTIILVGHSSGATVLPDMVARLDRLGAPVKLAIGLDSVFRTSLSGRVGRYINFYVANGNGEPVAPTRQLHGALENVDVGKTGVGHLTIDKSEYMQRRVISAIDAVAFGRPAEPSGAPRPPEASAAQPKPGKAGVASSARN